MSRLKAVEVLQIRVEMFLKRLVGRVRVGRV